MEHELHVAGWLLTHNVSLAGLYGTIKRKISIIKETNMYHSYNHYTCFSYACSILYTVLYLWLYV